MAKKHIMDPQASMCSSKSPQLNQQLSSFVPSDLLELTCQMHPQTNFFPLGTEIRYRKRYN